MPRRIAPTSAAVGSAMYHQCGRRSSATVSPSFNNFCGKGTAANYLSVAELAETGIAEPEVVPDFVHDGDAHRVDDVGFGLAPGEDRKPVDRDAVGHATAEAVVLPMGERHPLV